MARGLCASLARLPHGRAHHRVIGHGVVAHPLWRRRFGEYGERDEPGLRHVGRQPDRDAGDFRRLLERVAGRLETWLRAGDAGEAATQAGTAAVPGADIAVGVRLGALGFTYARRFQSSKKLL